MFCLFYPGGREPASASVCSLSVLSLCAAALPLPAAVVGGKAQAMFNVAYDHAATPFTCNNSGLPGAASRRDGRPGFNGNTTRPVFAACTIQHSLCSKISPSPTSPVSAAATDPPTVVSTLRYQAQRQNEHWAAQAQPKILLRLQFVELKRERCSIHMERRVPWEV